MRLFITPNTSASSVWHEFNDETVTPFDPDEIPTACFGSDAKTTGHTAASGTGAFLLVYDRVRSVLDESVAEEAEERIAMPPNVRQELVDMNKEFWHKKNVLDAMNIDFVGSLIDASLKHGAAEAAEDGSGASASASGGGPVLAALKLGTQFAFSTLSKIPPSLTKKESPADAKARKMAAWIEKLLPLYRESVEGCKWLLAHFIRVGALKNFFITNDDVNTTKALASLISTSLCELARRAKTDKVMGAETGASSSPSSLYSYPVEEAEIDHGVYAFFCI